MDEPNDNQAVFQVGHAPPMSLERALEADLLKLLDKLATLPGVDRRWLAIGRTHIEQGVMAVERARHAAYSASNSGQPPNRAE